MTFAELKTEIAVTNLARTDSDTLAVAGTAINWILREYMPKHGLKPFLKNTDLSTIANQEYVDLPSDFDGLQLARLLEDTGDYSILSDAEWEDFGVSDTAEPTMKMVLPSSTGWRLYLKEIPDDTYTINIWYFGKQTTLVNDSDIPVLSTIYGDAPIISGASWRTAIKLGIDNAAKRWEYVFIKYDLPELLNWQGKVNGYKQNHPTHNPYQ